ncbi:hypothetical protein DYB34_001738, partial [Aphanomyces astaci]
EGGRASDESRPDQQLPPRHDCWLRPTTRPWRRKPRRASTLQSRPGITLGRLALDRVQHPRATSEPNAAFAYLLQVYETSDFIDETLHVLAALSRFPFVKLKTRALEWAVAGGVRSQDIHGVFGSVAADCLKGVCAGQVGRFERTVLADRRGTHPVCIHRQLPDGTSHHGGRSVLGRPPQGAFARPLAQFLENIRTGAAMYARDMTPLAAWIQKLLDLAYVRNQWAIWLGNHIAVPISTSSALPERVHVLTDSGASHVIAHAKMDTSSLPVPTLHPSSPVPSTDDDLTSHLLNHEAFSNEVAMLLYTSSTTGPPKGVLATHAAWVAWATPVCARK